MTSPQSFMMIKNLLGNVVIPTQNAPPHSMKVKHTPCALGVKEKDKIIIILSSWKFQNVVRWNWDGHSVVEIAGLGHLGVDDLLVSITQIDNTLITSWLTIHWPVSHTAHYILRAEDLLVCLGTHYVNGTLLITEPGIAKGKKKKRKYLGGSAGMLPWKTVKVETKICAIWSILEANLKKFSTLKFIMNIGFLPSLCIHRSIILIYIEKSMLVDFFPTENTLFRDFWFSFLQNPCFCDEFQTL